jgi:lipopolysaccharide/colanic/teichoic acid biosynthesis glycosyltransferase
MVSNAEELKKDLLCRNEVDGPVFKIKDDPRVTTIGNFIRKTSLDELPQLINVIKGEMSLVGPRPALPEEVDQYSDFERKRLSVLPGLTCYWQVSGRNNISFDEWMELDIKYIRERNFWLDLKLILKTVKVLLGSKDAY